MDIESISARMRTATLIIHGDRHVTNNHRVEPTLLVSTYEVRVGSGGRALIVDGGGRRGRRHVCSDRTVHGRRWASVDRRAGAVAGLLHHVGGARLLDVRCES